MSATQSAGRKYPTLSANFWKGTAQGQVLAIHRDRDSQPARVKDFQEAIANKDLKIRPNQLTEAGRIKLQELLALHR
jgi:hypothetical protein